MSEFLTQVLANKKALYLKYEAAMLALEDPTIDRYDIDTGQTRQTVTRKNVLETQKMMEHLLSEIDRLEKRLNNQTIQYGRFGTGR